VGKPDMSHSNKPSLLALLIGALFLIAIAVIPLVLFYLGKTFWIDVFSRMIILAIAATSLYLLLGVAGLPSFGHAAFIGLGAYAVGIPIHYATMGGAEWLASYNGWWQFGLAILVSAVFALITGAISLRTRGVHFIMITMAFSQMIYYALISLEEYGADDGLSIYAPSEFPLISFDNPIHLFGVCYATLLLVMFVVHRLQHSRFGRVLQAAKQNETRVLTSGVNPFKYRLLAYVIAGVMAGIAGALMANRMMFISPSMVEWSHSGELMFMIILGGSQSLLGPLVGSSLFIFLEFVLSRWTVYWHLPFGLILLFVVLFGRGGIIGMLRNKGDAS